MQLRFKNGKFRILQVSDAQDLQHVRHTMMRMLNKAYDDVKPDLVVLTGDNILGNHLYDCELWTPLFVKDKESEKKAMGVAIDKLVSPIEQRKIPFAMIYGNHDDRNRLTKDEQADFYRAYSCNVGLDGTDSGDCDTYNIPVYSENGDEIKFNIWMLDSAWHDKQKDKCFEYIKPEAIEWYKKTSAELKAQNGGKPVPSLMFQHIPMLETFELVEECNEEDEGAVKGPDNKFIRLKPDVEGFLGEYISAVEKKTGQMEAIKECGDVKAVVFGHDHQNCFTGVVDGIDFIQTSCASFRCYGNRKRGVRVFDIDEATGDYETFFLTYEDIVGKSLWNEFCYIWDADDMWKKKVALIAGSVLGATAIGVGLGLLLK